MAGTFEIEKRGGVIRVGKNVARREVDRRRARTEVRIRGLARVQRERRDDLRQVFKLAAPGRLRPIVDRVLPLECLAEGQERLAGREHFGKIVVEV